MKAPIPTATEVRLVAWVCVLCFCLLTAVGCWAIVHKVNQSDEIVRVAAASADQVERLNRQLDAQEKVAADQRAAARRDSRLTHQQLRAVLRFVKSLGIDIPSALLAPAPSAGSSSTPKAPASSGASSSQTPRPTGTPGASPRPTTSPSATPTSGLDPVCALLNLPTCPLLP